MIRFEYKVLKSFAILKSLKGRKEVAHTDEEKQSGIKFGLSTRYVDYESEKEGVEQDEFTERLCTLGYLKLDKEIQMLKRTR